MIDAFNHASKSHVSLGDYYFRGEWHLQGVIIQHIIAVVRVTVKHRYSVGGVRALRTRGDILRRWHVMSHPEVRADVDRAEF
jgi:hypothetical protein